MKIKWKVKEESTYVTTERFDYEAFVEMVDEKNGVWNWLLTVADKKNMVRRKPLEFRALGRGSSLTKTSARKQVEAFIKKELEAHASRKDRKEDSED